MARNSATIDIGINVPASEMRKAEQQLQALFNKTQSFNKNPIVAKNFTQPLGRITGAANEFNKSLEASNARVIAFGASAGAIFAVQKAMSELVKTTIKVEQQLTNIQVLLNATGKDFERFSNGLFKAAKATGHSFYEVAESAEEFARQGLNVEQSLKRTTAAMTLAKLGGMDVKNATESLTAAINTFGKAAGNSTQIVNKMAQVDAKFAVSSGDLAEAIKRTGAAANSANVSFEELISIVTTAQEKTARGGAVIGNSFKTIFTRIQRPETLRQLESLGVAVRKTSGELLPAMKVLENYAKVYGSLAPSLRATSSEMLAGVFQVNVLKAVLPELANETGKYQKALMVANETTNEATQRMGLLTSTTEGMVNKTMVNLTKFATEVGALTVKPALDRILKMVNGFADLISPKNFFGLGETVGTAVYEGMGKIISGPGLALLGFVLVKIGAKLAVFVKDAAAGFMGMETASQKLASTQNIIQNILAQRPALINQATASEEGMVAVARVLAQKIKESRAEMEKLTLAAQKAAPAVLAMQGGAKRTGGKKPKAGGFIPSFNMGAASGFVPNFSQEVQEKRLAKAGGYQAGKIKEATIPGVGKVTYNGNEEIKKFPGLQQPGIMPPRTSSAGNNYRDSFKGVHGYDPYNSAGGFVPNFANLKLTSLGAGIMGKGSMSQSTITRKINEGKLDPSHVASGQGYSYGTQKNIKESKAGREPKNPRNIHTYNTQGAIGLLSYYGTPNKSDHAQLPIKKIPALSDLMKSNDLSNDSIKFTGLQISSLQSMPKKGDETSKKFSQQISDHMAGPMVSLTEQFLKHTGLNHKGRLKDKKGLVDSLKKSNAFLSPGTEGDIFENLARIATNTPGQLDELSEAGGSFKAPFDFEEGRGEKANSKFIKTFKFGSQLKKADAKRSATGEAKQSLINKAYTEGLLDDMGLGARFATELPGLGKNLKAGPGSSGARKMTQKQKLSTATRMQKAISALGFVPNFMAPRGNPWAEKQRAHLAKTLNKNKLAPGLRRWDDGERGGMKYIGGDEGGRMDYTSGKMHSRSSGLAGQEALQIQYNMSKQKGRGFQQFKELANVSQETGKPIYSSQLINQLWAGLPSQSPEKRKSELLGRMSPFEGMSKVAFPQLRHRMRPNMVTSGIFSMPEVGPEKKFRSLKQLQGMVGSMPKEVVVDGLRRNKIEFESLISRPTNNTSARADTGLLSKKTKAGGFIPNFALGGLGAAIDREDRAGVRRDQVRVGHDDRLNGGTGVYNTKEGSLGNAINMHLASGATMKSIQRQGKADGYIPNFAQKKQGGGDDMGMGMSMGMMMVGSQLSVMSDRLKETNEGVSTFSSSVLDLSASFAMYYPMIAMATQSYGGILGALSKLGTGISASIAGLAVWTKSVIASAKVSMGKSAFSGPLTKSGKPDMRFKANKGGGTKGLGARMGGGIARGGRAAYAAAAANPAVAIALAVAAVGIGVNKLMQGAYDAKGAAARKRVQEAAKKSAESFKNLNEHMSKASEATSAFGKALGKGDAAGVAAAKNDIIRSLNLAGIGDTMKRSGGVTVGKDKLNTKAEVISKIQDVNTSVEDIRELNAAIKSAASRFNQMAQGAGASATALDAFAQNQGMLYSKDTSAENMAKAAQGFASMLDGVGQKKAREMLKEFTNLKDSGKSLSDEYNISQDEAQAYNRKVVAQLSSLDGLSAEQKDLLESLKEMDQKVNLDEDDFMRLHMIINGKLLPILKRRATMEEGLIKEEDAFAKETSLLHDEIQKFKNNLKGLKNQITLKKSLTKLFEDQTLKMFDLGTKTLVDNLSKTASERTLIEFNAASEERRLRIKHANELNDLQVKKQEALMSDLETHLLSKVRGTEKLTPQKGGFMGKDFQNQINKKFGPAFFEAIRNADLSGADKAIADAIKMAKGPAGGAENRVVVANMKKHREALEDLTSATSREITVMRAKQKAEMDYAKAMKVAATAQLKLAQQISFAGGIGGAAGAPIKAFKDWESNKLNYKQGNMLGDSGRDLQTSGMIANLKMLRSLTDPGGNNPANAYVEPLTQQLQKNHRLFLDKMLGGSSEQIFSNKKLEDISRTQAKNLIKPDREIKDLFSQNERFSFDGKNNLKVFIANWQDAGKEGGGGTDPVTGLPIGAQGGVGGDRGPGFGGGGSIPGQPRANWAARRGLGNPMAAFSAGSEQSKELQRLQKQYAGGGAEGDKIAQTLKGREHARGVAAEAFARTSAALTKTIEGLALLKQNEETSLKNKETTRAAREAFEKNARGGTWIGDKDTGRWGRTPEEGKALPAGHKYGTPMYEEAFRAGKPDFPSNKRENTREYDAMLANESTWQRAADEATKKRVAAEKSIANLERAKASQEKAITQYNKEIGQLKTELQNNTTSLGKLTTALNQLDKGGMEKSRENVGSMTTMISKAFGEMSNLKGFAGTKEGDQMIVDGFYDMNELLTRLTDDDGVLSAADMKQLKDSLEEIKTKAQMISLGETSAPFGDGNPLNPVQAGRARDKVETIAAPSRAANMENIAKAVQDFSGSNRSLPDKEREKVEKFMTELSDSLFKNQKGQDLDLKDIDPALMAEKLKQARKEIMLFQDTINMSSFTAGRKNFEEVQNGISKTMDALVNDAKGKKTEVDLTKQIDQLLKLSEARDKESAAIKGSIDARDVILETSSSMQDLRLQMSKYGIEGEVATNAMSNLGTVLRSVAADGEIAGDDITELAEAMRKAQEAVKKSKREKGFLDPDQFKSDITKFLQEGVEDGTRQAGESLKGYVAALGDVGNEAVRAMRSSEVTKKLGSALIGSLNAANAQVIESQKAAAVEYYKVTGDLAAAIEKNNELDLYRTEIAQKVSNGIITQATANFLLSEKTKEATHATAKLNRELGMLGSYDPKKLKQDEVDRNNAKMLKGGSTYDNVQTTLDNLSNDDVYNPLNIYKDAGRMRDKREGEVKGAFGASLNTKLGAMNAGMEADNTDIGARRAMGMALTKQNLNKLENDSIELDKKRVDILNQLKDGQINANQAEIRMAKARAPMEQERLNLALADGTIAQAEYESGMRALAETMMEGDMSAGDFNSALKSTLMALTHLEKNAAQKDFIKMIDRNGKAFKDGVKDAFAAAINGTMTFREAMAKVMQDIAADMLSTSISSLVNTAFNAVGKALIPQPGAPGAATGGHVVGGIRGVQTFQKGGLVSGGKGGVDDIPARLGRGEYVIKESSARKYGTNYLNDLNAGRVNKFAAGGSADSARSNLQNTYDWNDPKKPTAGSFNVDSRLSALGQMDSSNPQNAYKFSREATLDQYLKDKAADDEMKKNAMMAYKTQRRKIIQSAVMQIAMVGIQAGMQSMGSSPKAKNPKTGKPLKSGEVLTKGGKVIKPGSSGWAQAISSAPVSSIGGTPAQIEVQQYKAQGVRDMQMAKTTGFPATAPGGGVYGSDKVARADRVMEQMQDQAMLKQFTKDRTPKQNFLQQLLGFQPGANYGSPLTTPSKKAGGTGKKGGLGDVNILGATSNLTKGDGGGGITRPKTMIDASRLKLFRQDHDTMHVAAGGPAHTRGRDTVPAMLTAGEWVVPKETVDLYGMGFMNKLNKGEVQHFAEGGYVGPRGGGETPSSGGGSASSVNNDFTINVNVTNEGGGSDDGRTALGEKDQNTQGGLEENERNKELGVRIKGAVVQEIVYQKRPGGLLYSEKRS